MARLSVAVVFSALACCASALPLNKRIAQTIADSTQKWQAACLAAGGADKCNPLSVRSFSTLLAAAGNCDQQNSADDMIDLAKTLNNDPDMIKFAQIFVQQPRNSPNSVAVPYCETAPRNAELNGLFQCQFKGSDQTTFVGNLKVGANGTIPFGMSAPLSPPGSCPANPSGPIADGSQLVDQVSSPGTVATTGGGSSNSTAAPSSVPVASASAVAVTPMTSSVAATVSDSVPVPTASASDSCDGSDSQDDGSATASPTSAVASATAAPASATATASSSNGGGFQLKNGQDAQALNAKFAVLNSNSVCSEGDQGCVGGGFAQCVSGAWVTTQCAGGTQCFALPLVNKAGTSIACTTQGDALARIQATGAQGGITGN